MAELGLALPNLPDSADGIAAYFIEQECRGVPGDAHCCPVANYLLGQGFDAASVSGDRIEVCDDSGFVEASTPEAVAAFLTDFDDHVWPELELSADEGMG